MNDTRSPIPMGLFCLGAVRARFVGLRETQRR